MKSVTLKGKGNKYFLELNSDTDFSESLTEIKKMLQQLVDSTSQHSQKIPIVIDSQNRLLTSDQFTEIKTIISEFAIFELQHVVSNVFSRQKVEQLLDKNFLNIETKIIRSGKVVDYQGNLLLLGNVHKGAIVRATGDIYIGSHVEGIVHAGFPNYSGAILTGDISHASQIRISDLIQIVADMEEQTFNNNSLFYINDLHVLTQDNISNLHEIKPRREIILG